MKNRLGITRFSWLAAMTILLSFLVFAGEARANYLFYNADTGREVFSNAVEAPSLYVLSGNVGVGTATTPSLLTVSKANGTSYVAEFQNTTAATPYTLRVIEPPSATAGYPLLNVHNNAATTEYFRVNSGGNSYFMGGNVGVGTTTPTYKLEVVSGTNNPFYLNGTYNKIQANAGFTEIESFHNTRLVIDSTNSYTDRFFSVSKGASYIGGGSPTELFRITEGGNVGIGTAAPATKLDVSGGIIRQSGYSVSDAATDNLLVNGDFEMGGIYGWSGLDSAVSGGYSGNYAAQRTASQTVLSDDYIPVDPIRDVLQLEGYFKKTVAGVTPGLFYFGYIAYNASKSAITTAPCGTYCYFAAAGYTLPADGAWHKFSATTTGEGTSYPNFPVGTKYVRVLVLINYSASADAVTQMDHVTLRRINSGPLFVGNNFNGSNLVDQYQVSQLYTTSANNLIIEPSASGNVGIGTASPTTKLEVSGTVKATAFEGGSYAGTINAGNVSAGTFGSNTGYGNYTFKESASPNNPILHVDALNGRVGVGTTAPVGRLDVSSATGSGANTSLNIIGTGTGAQTWSLYPSTSQSLTLLRPGLRLATFLNDGGFAVGGLSDDIGSGADFYVNGTSGNVGVGTTAPGAKLDVSGSGRFASNLSLRGDGLYVGSDYDATYNDYWKIFMDGQTANAGILHIRSGDDNTEPIYFEQGTNVRMAVGNSGNIGIGTTSPGAGLDVQKAVTASALVANGVNLQQTLTATANNDVLSALKINPTFVPGAFTGVTQYAINATGTIKGTSFEGALSGTVNAGNVSAGSFGLNTGGGNYTFPANVGIGMTTAPENWLHIKNATKDTTTSPNEVGLTLESAVSTNQKYQLGVGVSGISNQYFSLRDITAGAYRMVVNTSGYVGIGTTSPNAILHVATSGGITPIRATNNDYNGTTVGSGFGISFGAVTGDTYAKLQAFDAGGASSSDLILQSAGGNVGIGTTSPGSTLDVGGTSNTAFVQNLSAWGLNARAQGLIIMPEGNVSDDGAGNLILGSTVIIMNPLSGSYIRVAAGTYALGTWGSLWAPIPPTGTRGTTVVPTVLVWTDADRNYDGRDRVLLAQRMGAGKIMTRFGNFANLTGTTGHYLMNGNVGIGTTSPSQKLDVAGGAKMTTLNQGAGTNERFYPNVVSVNNDGTATTGAWIINTPVPRASDQMFRMRVHGYAYGTQDSIDFTIVGYPYSGSLGSIDGLGGAIVSYDLQDNGTDGLEKWVGVNSSGKVAIALGNTTLSSYFYRLSVDAWITRTTADYSSGWSITQSAIANFGFLDIKGPLTSSLKNTIFVNSTGNVGIGTVSPTTKLEVSGEVKATTFTGTYAGTINAGNVSSGTFGSNTGYGNYTFKESALPNNPILHVDATNGRVGVGTSSPWAKLQVAAPSGTTNTFNILDSSSGYAWSFYNVTNGLGTDLRIYETTSAADRITIAKGGYLGIGQMVPVANLDILGANASLIKITRSSVANANIQYSNGTYNMYAGLNPAGNFGVSSSADLTSAPFIVTSAGLVGVSQPTPTTTLDVGGVVNATTGYRVAGAATSGYFLRGNGTNFVSAQIQASDIPSGAIAAGTLSREDNRQISPSELTAGNLKFGFTTYRNDNGGVPYADFLHLRSYTDSSGGNDNLLVINKAALGMRVYQQAWGSVSAYTSYKDVVLADNTPSANYLTKYVGTGTNVSVGNSQIFDNGTSVGIGNASPGAKLAVTGGVLIGNADAEQGYSLTWRGRSDLGIDEDGYSLVIGAPEGIRINLDSNNNATGTNFEIAKDVNAKTGGTVLFMVRESDGFVGIAKTNPATALDVNGTVTATSFSGALAGTVSAGNVSSGTFGLNTGYGNFTFAESASPNNPVLHVDALNGRVGIGTTSPGSSLQISTSNQFRVYVSEGIILPTYYYLGDINYNNGILKVSGILGGHQQSQGRADVNLTFSVRDAFTALGNVWGAVGTGSDIVVYNDTVASKYKVYLKTDDYGLVNLNLTAVSGATVGYTGSGSTTAPAYGVAIYVLSTDAGGVVRSLTDGNVGIGIIPTADPSGYNLDVGPGGSYTARLGTSSADTVLIGGGSGKLNVGTIDPIYTIGAKRYATYTTAMTGVKEETSGTIRLQKTGNRYMATLDFGSAEEGSDLWLFYQVTGFDSEWDGLSVLLSSGFDGSVWYEKDAAEKVIRIYGAPAASALSSGEPMEVSYRLTAPRFDHGKWSNYSEDEAEGFKLDVKE